MRSNWTVIVEEDPETGELMLPFSDEMLSSLGWKEGDTLTWTVKTNGSIILSKKEMKMKYTLIAEDEFGGAKTTREFQADYLPDVLSEVELFLRGAGFFFTGNLDFVDFAETDTDFELEPEWHTEEFDTPQEEMYDSKEVLATKSPHYFDTERNK